MMKRPDRSEATDYYFSYIEKVPPGDIIGRLETQGDETLMFLADIPEELSLSRYAPGKWTIRETLGHINDTERLFVFRAFWFARGFESPLPSFDPGVAVSAARSNDRSWRSLVEEFRAVRAATVPFFRSLPPDAWDRRGIASGNPFSVRALAFLAAGHVIHHAAILREKYLAESRP